MSRIELKTGLNPEETPVMNVVVIGHGMVGHKLLECLVDEARSALHITVLCEEPRPAYDRVHLSDDERRLLVACGASAGIAAAYNAPIAGALFVAEVVLGSIAMESFGPLIVASVVSDATSRHFLGYGPVYQVPHINFGAWWELGLYALLGVKDEIRGET